MQTLAELGAAGWSGAIQAAAVVIAVAAYLRSEIHAARDRRFQQEAIQHDYAMAVRDLMRACRPGLKGRSDLKPLAVPQVFEANRQRVHLLGAPSRSIRRLEDALRLYNAAVMDGVPLEDDASVHYQRARARLKKVSDGAVATLTRLGRAADED